MSTVNDRDTAALSFPGASIALTKKVWALFASGEPRVNGEEHAKNGWASTRHWKVEPASFEEKPKVEPASFEEKEKLGVESLVKLPRLGPEVMLA